MFTRRSVLSLIGTAALVLCATPAAAQDVVVTGPPPELRKNLDGFQKAFNSGNPSEYEAMAKATFTPEFYKRQTADERKAWHAKTLKQLGTIAFTRVERNGPEAPLEIQVKGSVAPSVFWIDIDESSRIAGIRVETGKMNH